ncbi:MAG: PQQ-dependent dehydrogenase, methanol/ethanol family, partial [Burkholderiales bacterium]
MKAFRRLSALPMVLALAAPSLALANADLEKLMANPKNWAAQAGNMENHRYSQLKQINKANVKNMKVAWLFST